MEDITLFYWQILPYKKKIFCIFVGFYFLKGNINEMSYKHMAHFCLYFSC